MKFRFHALFLFFYLSILSFFSLNIKKSNNANTLDASSTDLKAIDDIFNNYEADVSLFYYKKISKIFSINYYNIFKLFHLLAEIIFRF